MHSKLSKEQEQNILLELNSTIMDYPKHKCFHQLFEEQVEKKPHNIAVIFEDQRLSYKDLHEKVTQLAIYLKLQGVVTGTIIGVLMKRSIDLLIGLLAIMKAGGVYVPLDPKYPKNRLKEMLDDTGLEIILTQTDIEDRIPECDALFIRLNKDWEQIIAGSYETIDDKTLFEGENSVRPDNLVYIIYTSGSTGIIKGVQVYHSALVNFLWSMAIEPGCSENDHVLALTTICFDIAGLELYLPLLNGGKVEILSELVCKDGHSLKERIESGEITMIQATPETYKMLLAAGWMEKRDIKILCGGESWNSDLAEKLLERGSELWNVYGPTETTIWSTVKQIRAGEKITIGHPIGNTQVFVLDNKMQPVPIGETGELYIGGDGVAAGYFKRPELTAERFIQSPFNENKNMKIYKTGDIAKCLPNGEIECLGRIDNQVKIRGFRIELGEIESRILEFSKVVDQRDELSENQQINQVFIKDVVVIVKSNDRGEKDLVAYIIPNSSYESDTITESILKLSKYLRDVLPEYMVPLYINTLGSFPLTPNGKLDKKALPEPQAHLKEDYVAPRNEMEQSLASIFSDILGIEKVGINNGFYQIGGNSLNLSALIYRLRKSGFKIEFIDIVNNLTVAKLAKHLLSKNKDGEGVYVATNDEPQNDESISNEFNTIEIDVCTPSDMLNENELKEALRSLEKIINEDVVVWKEDTKIFFQYYKYGCNENDLRKLVGDPSSLLNVLEEEKKYYRANYAHASFYNFAKKWGYHWFNSFPCAFFVHMPLDMHLLNKALNNFVEECSILRTQPLKLGQTCISVIHNQATVRFEEIKVNANDEDTFYEKIRSFCGSRRFLLFEQKKFWYDAYYFHNDGDQFGAVVIRMFHFYYDGYASIYMTNKLIDQYKKLKYEIDVDDSKKLYDYYYCNLMRSADYKTANLNKIIAKFQKHDLLFQTTSIDDKSYCTPLTIKKIGNDLFNQMLIKKEQKKIEFSTLFFSAFVLLLKKLLNKDEDPKATISLEFAGTLRDINHVFLRGVGDFAIKLLVILEIEEDMSIQTFLSYCQKEMITAQVEKDINLSDLGFYRGHKIFFDHISFYDHYAPSDRSDTISPFVKGDPYLLSHQLWFEATPKVEAQDVVKQENQDFAVWDLILESHVLADDIWLTLFINTDIISRSIPEYFLNNILKISLELLDNPDDILINDIEIDYKLKENIKITHGSLTP